MSINFTIDPPGDSTRCIRWETGGTRPASAEELALWDAVQSAPAPALPPSYRGSTLSRDPNGGHPFMYVYEFVSPFGGTVWRDSPAMWNGNRPKRSMPLYDRPPAPAPAEPVIQFDDQRVQIVYGILCADEAPPSEQHWEGWVARRIVDALTPAPTGPLIPLEEREGKP